MKRFIILSSTIRNVGGAQLYAANKLAYYEKLGWIPDMYFFNPGPIKIEYLKRFEKNCLPDLAKPLRDTNRAIIDSVISKILGDIRPDDEILFECHMPHLAFWGELLAEKSRGKNTVYLLEEIIPKFTFKEAAFYEFKIKRKELLNTGEKGLKRIFKNYYQPGKFGPYNYPLEPYCSNVVDYNSIKIPEDAQKADYSIISIGRLDKPYIKPMLDEILVFIKRHKDKCVNLITVGGDLNDEMSNYIKGLFMEEKNVKLFLLGYLVPIPYGWIKISDIAIASSNSILVSSDEGIPTIAIDIQDMMPLGIYKHTTNNLRLRDGDPIIPINVLLEDVLVRKRFCKQLVDHNEGDDLAKHLKPHLDLLNISDPTKKYFDVLGIYSPLEQVMHKFRRRVGALYHTVADEFIIKKKND